MWGATERCETAPEPGVKAHFVHKQQPPLPALDHSSVATNHTHKSNTRRATEACETAPKAGVNAHLVHEQQPPLPALDLVDDLLRLLGAPPAERHHVVRGYANRGLVSPKPLLVLGREARDLLVLDGRPQLELVRPLIHGHAAGDRKP